jgi:hypothetical protein
MAYCRDLGGEGGPRRSIPPLHLQSPDLGRCRIARVTSPEAKDAQQIYREGIEGRKAEIDEAAAGSTNDPAIAHRSAIIAVCMRELRLEHVWVA